MSKITKTVSSMATVKVLEFESHNKAYAYCSSKILENLLDFKIESKQCNEMSKEEIAELIAKSYSHGAYIFENTVDDTSSKKRKLKTNYFAALYF